MQTNHLANWWSVPRSLCLLWVRVGITLLATASWLMAGPISIENIERRVFSTGAPGGNYVSSDEGLFREAAAGVVPLFVLPWPQIYPWPPSIFPSVVTLSGSATQESDVVLTNTALRVKAFASASGERTVVGETWYFQWHTNVAAGSTGAMSFRVSKPCSFTLTAGIVYIGRVSIGPGGVAGGGVRIRLSDGETVLAEYSGGSGGGSTSGVLVPGHTYALSYIVPGGAYGLYGDPYAYSQSCEIKFDVTPPPEITSLARASNAHFVLSGQAEPLAAINIEASPDLVGPFVSIGQTASDMNGNYQFDDPDAATMPKRFYRASYVVQ